MAAAPGCCCNAAALGSSMCMIAPPRMPDYARFKRRLNATRYRSWLWPHRRRESAIVTNSNSRKSSSSSYGNSAWWRQTAALEKCIAVFVATVVAGLVALQLRGRALAYVESKVLPPVAALLTARIGRRVELGRVQGVWPLGITLGPCHIGSHEQEFSCAAAPGVSIRIRPLRSIQRRRIVTDVVLSQPQVLVCQKRDWTWLGLPVSPAEKFGRLDKSSQQDEAEVLDSRTSSRLLAKQLNANRLAADRDSSASSAALRGYMLPECCSPASLQESKDENSSRLAFWAKPSEEKARLREWNMQSSAAMARAFFHTSGRRIKSTRSHEVEAGAEPVTDMQFNFSKLEDDEPAFNRSLSLAFPMQGLEVELGFGSTVQGRGSYQMALEDGVLNPLHHQETQGFDDAVNVTAAKDETGLASSSTMDDVERSDSGSLGINLDSVYFRDGTLMLLAYGDNQVRVMDEVNGHVKFANNFEQITAELEGLPKAPVANADDGYLQAKVLVDIAKQHWHVNLRTQKLFAPLLERLIEVPVDWHHGTVDGEVHLWMDKHDRFPSFGGKLNLKELGFKIWEAPSGFKEVSGMLFLQGQRAFLHNTTGFYGAIPLSVSGDTDLNPESGEYRLSCQVSGIEVNALMDTLKVRPLPFPVAGAVKGVVYCRGPLDAPIFEGGGDTLKNRTDLIFATGPSVATESIKQNISRGAAAAYDHVTFSSASANFTFNTASCIANIYGIRAAPVGGGEIRGAGDMWICPEAENDPTAIKIDCSGHVFADDVIQSYVPSTPEINFLGALHGETKIRGSLLSPVFDIKWIMADAKGPLSGARGEAAICEESITLSSASPAFDLSTKLLVSPKTTSMRGGMVPVEGIEADIKLRGFDIMGLVTSETALTADGAQMKVSGRVKYQGRVGESGLVGDVSLWNMKLNQLFIASQLAGSLELSETGLKLSTTGRGKDQLIVLTEQGGIRQFSLQRGQLQIGLSHTPRSSAKLQIINLPLDELEISSLRGCMHKVDIQLNLEKRRGHGHLSVRRPRFSGIHGELLDVSARWSGDVVTLEKSILEQAKSQYELQGEYVLPGRDRGIAPGNATTEGIWQRMTAGNFGKAMSALGRWRLRLEVPRAELADMLPVARLLSRSSDPAIVSRSKELFLQGVERASFIADTLKQEMEYVKRGAGLSSHGDSVPEEEVSLPGLAELTGRWYGAIEASGGGDSDSTANFDLHGENWTWGTYNIQTTIATGSYCSTDGLRLEKAFLQKDTATLHADGVLGPNSSLHFALLNFPVELVPPLMQAIRSSSVEPLSSTRTWAPISGVLHMEGDVRGSNSKPECDVQVRLLDGAIGGINLSRAELSSSLTSSRQFVFDARLEPVTHAGHVHFSGSIPVGSQQGHRETEPAEVADKRKEKDDDPWQVGHGKWDFVEAGTLCIDATIKDSGMLLVAAVTPELNWLQGTADVRLQVRGTFDQPKVDGLAVFHKVAISSPVLARPITNLGGIVSVRDTELFIENVEGRAGKRGRVYMKGRLPLKSNQESSIANGIELKTESLEVRAKNTFSGQVDGQVVVMGSFLEPELTGSVKLSHGEVYLSQERNAKASTIPRALTDLEFIKEDNARPGLPVAVALSGLKLQLGPELRMVYPLILNFAVLGELELHGFADLERIRPRGVLTFENGDVNLVATQVRLNKDYMNRAKFEPEQGLDPSLDLALVGAHWHLKVQGRAQNWQDSIVLSCARSGEQDALTRTEAAKLFENQLVDSLLEGNGQFAFKKLAAATVETLMPKIETKGEFGQARWRLVYAPQIPNLLSLDPTTDPFKSLANLSFGTEVEVQLGRRLKASVVRQVKESEMATQWTLTYELSNKLRLVFSSIPSVDSRLLFEYSASSSKL